MSGLICAIIIGLAPQIGLLIFLSVSFVRDEIKARKERASELEAMDE